MNKEILFLWFGDQKPIYTEWTLENFKLINPTWKIRFISYSNNQIINYQQQNDNILINAILKWKTHSRKDIGELSNLYRIEYLKNSQNLVFYCDLDCFPIAPFDNFIISKETEKNIPSWISNIFCKNTYHLLYLGTNTDYTTSNKNQLFKNDMWCMFNNKCILTSKFLQIHKESFSEENLLFYKGMLMNKYNLNKYLQRSNDFHNCRIKIGDNFCMKKFTPIEHYYSLERNFLNKNITCEIIKKNFHDHS